VAFEVWLPEDLPDKTADFTADEPDELAEILRDLAEDPFRSDGLSFLTRAQPWASRVHQR
jgi:hypothetical protein